MKFKLPLRLQWLIYNLQHYFKMPKMPHQLDRVAEDPRSLPSYQRQVAFLKENGINKPYDCLQCRSFDLEMDGCPTPYLELYGMVKRGDRMCPGFDPPEKGKFEFVVRSVDDLV